MTDSESYLRDLEAAAVSVGSIPNDYALLRDLLGNLPSGTPPDVRAGRTGVTAQAAGVGGLDATGLTIQSGVAPGSESGSGIGVSQAPALGLRNLFTDPRMTSIPAAAGIALGAAYAGVMTDWDALYTVGTTGGTAKVQAGLSALAYNGDPLHTSAMGLEFQAWTAAGTATMKARGLIGNKSYDPTILPFVVFSVTLFRDTVHNQLFTQCSAVTVQLKITDSTEAVTHGFSTVYDFKGMAAGSYVRLWAVAPSSVLNATTRAVILVTVTTTGASGGVGGGNFQLDFGNPQFEIAPYQTPSLWIGEPGGTITTATVGAGSNRTALGVARFDDAIARLSLGLSAADEGRISWGPGGVSSSDLRILRSAAAVLRFDDNAAGRASLEGVAGTAPATPGAGFGRLYFASSTKTWHGVDDAGVDTDLGLTAAGVTQVSRAATAAAADYVARIRITTDTTYRAFLGLTAADEGSLEMGAGGVAARDLRLRRSGAKLWTADDAAGGNITLNVVGTLQQGGTGVSIIGHGIADHADVARTQWVDSRLMGPIDTATFIAVGATPNVTNAINYPDAATTGAVWVWRVPADIVAASAITMTPVWTPAATDAVAHTVRWQTQQTKLPAAADITAAGTAVATTGASAARTINLVVVDTALALSGTFSAGDLIRFDLQRVGADAADTYVGAVRLVGVIMSYTATQ